MARPIRSPHGWKIRLLPIVFLATLVLAARAQVPAAGPPAPQQTTPSTTATNVEQYLAVVKRVPNTPTPTATATPTRTPTVTAGPSPTPTLTASPGPSPTPSATATVGPSPTPTLPPPSFNDCKPDPNAANAPNYPVKIIAVLKTANPEVVRLQNVSANPVSLVDWNMCSFNTQQPHDDIDGVLAPGEVRDFPYVGGVTGGIWDDAVPNDGALYNAGGRPISFWDE